MSDSCGAGGCDSCSFGQRLGLLNSDDSDIWPVVMVRFRESSRTRFFAPGNFEVLPNDWVVVDTSRGEEAGKVIATPREVKAAVFAGPLKPLLRLAEPWEVEQVGRLERHAKVAMVAFHEAIRDLRVAIKPIRAEYALDGKRLTFYYSTEGKAETRDLIRQLNERLHARVELRQVGVRDEARLIGGVGKCGRSLCCSSWLQTYPSVTVKQAKTQDLPLNPTKISGVCGRLLCCLSYENEQYLELKRELPRLAQVITTPDGSGKVIGLHTLRGSVVVYIEGRGVSEYPAATLRELARQDERPVEGVRAPKPPAPVAEADAERLAPAERVGQAEVPPESPRGPVDGAADRPRRNRRRSRRGGRAGADPAR